MTPSYEEMPSGEFCVQRDIGAKDFGDRTVLLGVFCELRKFSFVEIGHLRAQRQSRTADLESFALRFKTDGRLRADLGWVKACHFQAERERHGEAPGVSSGDQLLGVRAFFVFKTGFERIWRAGEHSGVGGKLAVCVTSRPAPNRFRFADHRNLL